MAIIDERFRKLLMMDYATKEGQNNQVFLKFCFNRWFII